MFKWSRLFFEPKEERFEVAQESRCGTTISMKNRKTHQIKPPQEMELDEAYIMRCSHLWSRGGELFEMVEMA